jgi:hypothetical protein
MAVAALRSIAKAEAATLVIIAKLIFSVARSPFFKGGETAVDMVRDRSDTVVFVHQFSSTVRESIFINRTGIHFPKIRIGDHIADILSLGLVSVFVRPH